MKHYSESDLQSIRASDDFQGVYDLYKSSKSELNDLAQFCDSIKLNSKYFRLTMNTKHRGRRFRNRNLGEDTIAIKEVNSYLNKLTDRTLEKITKEIETRLKGRDYLREMIFRSIVDKSLLYTLYIPSYITLLENIYSDDNWAKEFIHVVEESYQELVNHTGDTTQSDYLQFCDKNKRLDKLIGHSLLILECEKKGMVKDRVHPRLHEMIETIRTNESDEERYKCVQCIYQVMKSLYMDQSIPQDYSDKIGFLIANEQSMKIKFKMMDILERK